MKATIIFFFLFIAFSFSKIRFDGEKVVRFQIHNESEAQILRNFVSMHNLDVWAEHPGSQKGFLGEVDVRISPFLARYISALNIESTVFIADIQRLVDEEEMRQSIVSDDFFTTYRTYKEHMAFLASLVTQYPDIASLTTLGKTVGGKDIIGIVISSKVNPSKPGIFYNGGQHAREWISPATVAYIAYKLASGYGNNETITKMVDSFEWTLVPIVNVDGYEYTFSSSRLWRKNRRLDTKTGCYGVDNNRNWPFKWNTGGSSTNPCDETYCGPSAGSEPENTAVANYLLAHTNLEGYIDFHSYSQLWMTPWGYSKSLPKDDTTQKKCGSASVSALKSYAGTSFDVGNIANIIYVASGSSTDFAYGAANIVIGFGVELRDTGRYGFLLPANQIVPSGEETFLAVIAMSECILNA